LDEPRQEIELAAKVEILSMGRVEVEVTRGRIEEEERRWIVGFYWAGGVVLMPTPRAVLAARQLGLQPYKKFTSFTPKSHRRLVNDNGAMDEQLSVFINLGLSVHFYDSEGPFAIVCHVFYSR
jgi:hypothetical protein